MNQPSVEPEYMVESGETHHTVKLLGNTNRILALVELEALLQACNMQVDTSERIRDLVLGLALSLEEQR